MGIKVRGSEARDLEWLLGQLKSFSRFFDSKLPLFGDEEHVRAAVSNLIENHVLLVAEHEGVPIGFVGGFIMPHPFNPKITVLVESLWWISDEYRGTAIGSRAGLDLLNEFTEIGERHSDWIMFTLQEKHPVGERALKRRGFHVHERTFLKEVV